MTSQTGSSDVTVGRNACCSNTTLDDSLEISFWSLMPEMTSCTDAPRMCGTMLILYVDKSDDARDVMYFDVNEVAMELEDVARLTLHYQVCGVDDLHFVLPLSCKNTPHFLLLY